jgi:hypothetical protein
VSFAEPFVYGECVRCLGPLTRNRRRTHLECPRGHREQLIIKPADAKHRDKDTCVMCGEPGVHAHHRLFASAGGLCEWANMITLCLLCHQWITDEVDREVAERLGVRIPRHETRHPSQVPVVYHLLGSPVLLTTDGSVRLWEKGAAWARF